MKGLLILPLAIVMSCISTGKPSQKLSDMQTKTEILASESQGGSDQIGFKIITNENDFKSTLQQNSGFVVETGSNTEIKTPVFPKDKKVVLYNQGMYRSGDHRISEIKSISVKDNILYVEVPAVESSGMEIQVISNPWFIFTVPSSYQFKSVELKYSK